MPPQRKHSGMGDLFRKIPFHPFLLAAYPILSLLVFNINQIYVRDVFKPIQLAMLMTAIALVLLRLLSRSWHMAGLLTSLLVVWFFVYGHLYDQIKSLNVSGVIVGRHRYLLVVWSLVILVLAISLFKKSRILPGLTLGLNLLSLVLISIPLVQIGRYQVRSLNNLKSPAMTTAQISISWTGKASPPDIYFIVLDGYGRSDALQKVEGIDNSAFLNSLQQLGFYVAGCSQSNYMRTLLSLSSVFNMEYIQTLAPQLKTNLDTAQLIPSMKHNLVRRQLEGLGYKAIVFENPWEGWVWDDAAMVYRSSGTGLLSPFEYLLLSMTVTRFYLDQQQAKTNQLAHYSNYEDTLYALDQLKNVPGLSGPKFVFAHLIVPHAPFVFGPDGEYIDILPYDTVKNLYTDEDHRRGYTAAVTYINKRMLEILPILIQSSRTPPIIILVGDHGTGESDTVTQNLAAFFTPGSASPFYATITPVNIFRVVFDAYFNGNFGRLLDHSYFSAGGEYFNFQEITNPCKEP